MVHKQAPRRSATNTHRVTESAHTHPEPQALDHTRRESECVLRERPLWDMRV